MNSERLDRQFLIENWNQEALSSSKIGIIGDDDLLASFFILSAAALGINRMVVVAPRLDKVLIEIGRNINPDLDLITWEGYYTHFLMDDLFSGCNALIDTAHYGLADKLLLQRGFRENVPVLKGACEMDGDGAGMKIFSYLRGREWHELNHVVSPKNLPVSHFDDPILDMIASGMLLDEVKNFLMGKKLSEEIIVYKRPDLDIIRSDIRICVVGAGALGNLVGLGLAFLGFENITFFDPDVIEVTNLNRQVLFYDAVGSSKAHTLANRLNALFGINAGSRVEYFRADTDTSPYDVVFDCVDNFETRVVLSEKCKSEHKVLISGGTSVEAGQMVFFDPMGDSATPAELLGLHEIVDRRKIETYERDRASCVYRPDPSVIMTNQIVAGLMVDALRLFVAGHKVENVFYDSTSDKKL